MKHSAPLELLTDATGSITFGWADEGVFFARFTRSLSARVGEAFAGRLRACLPEAGSIQYFWDARSLESYDLLARSAIVRVLSEHRPQFEQIHLLSWAGGEPDRSFLSALGDSVLVSRDDVDFETRLIRAAPRARAKLAAHGEARPRTRWPLRR